MFTTNSLSKLLRLGGVTMALLLCAQGSHAAQRTKIVGGDLSLVPAYEAAGDKWLDADGKEISDMISYVKKCGWNAVRVRLFEDPSKDNDPATCQNYDYVAKLGKRIKDAGLLFLLDIHYSDTWADVSHQAIPAKWSMTGNTATATLASKVYNVTIWYLTNLKKYGATPDYVQVGNEISYGMLWDTATYNGQAINMASTKNRCYTNSYSAADWQRFATLVSNGCKAVRATLPNAKIIIHTERTIDATQESNFYTFLQNAGLSNKDYDIIGLSYYPFWHGTLDQLATTIKTLETNYPDKEIQIVETAWLNGKSGYPSSAVVQKSELPSTWTANAAGQYNFLTDLQSKLKDDSHVTGLYYWQPEECGNGNDGTTNRVMANWDGRGFWNLSWESGKHSLISKDALMSLKNFATTYDDSYTSTSGVESHFTNLGFEGCTVGADGSVATVPGWIKSTAWKTNWAAKKDSYVNSGVSGSYYYKAWNGQATEAGNLVSQTATSLPNGTYTVTALVHASASGISLFANNDKSAEAKASSTWSDAQTLSVTTTVTDGTLSIGLYSNAQTGTDVSVYADNFTVSLTGTTVDGISYTLDTQNQTATVTGYTAELPVDVKIPASIRIGNTDYTVTAIADNAFKGNTSITSVRTGNNVTSIGSGAFSDCSQLHYISTGDQLATIGDNAFASCPIVAVVLNAKKAISFGNTPFTANVVKQHQRFQLFVPDGLQYNKVYMNLQNTYGQINTTEVCKTTVIDGVIYGLWGDMHATVAGYTDDLPVYLYVPSTLHFDMQYVPCTQYFMGNIEQYALAGAAQLKQVTIANNLNEIDAGAFHYCTNLESVTVGEDLKVVYNDVFVGDTKLKSLRLYTMGTMDTWGRLRNSAYNSPLDATNSVTLSYPSGSTAFTATNTASGKTIAADFNAATTFQKTAVTLQDNETTKTPDQLLKANTTSRGTVTEHAAQDVSIARKMTAGSYYTIVLPFDMNQTETAALGNVYDLRGKTSVSGSTLHIYVTEVTTMQGGVPYLVKWKTTADKIDLGLRLTSDYQQLVRDASEKGADYDVEFYGTYNKISIPQGDFFIAGSKLYKAADGTNTCGGYRGLFTIPSASAAKAISNIVYDIPGSTTGIEQIDASSLQPVGSVYYDLSGRRFSSRPTQKGIYIVNGKKVMIK